jgi:hypothetical protein
VPVGRTGRTRPLEVVDPARDEPSQLSGEQNWPLNARRPRHGNSPVVPDAAYTGRHLQTPISGAPERKSSTPSSRHHDAVSSISYSRSWIRTSPCALTTQLFAPARRSTCVVHQPSPPGSCAGARPEASARRWSRGPGMGYGRASTRGFSFRIRGGKIAQIDLVANPEHLAQRTAASAVSLKTPLTASRGDRPPSAVRTRPFRPQQSATRHGRPRSGPRGPGDPARRLVGRELRSNSPFSPSVRYRRSHLYAVALLIPSSSATCAAGQPASTRRTRSCRLKTLSLGLGCPTREPSLLRWSQTPQPEHEGSRAVNDVWGDYT